MKHDLKKKLSALLLAAILTLGMSVSALAEETPYRYAHDPRLNASAMEDVIADPTAIYGFRPDPASARLGSFADFDWSDAAVVAGGRADRIEYHESLRELYELEESLAAQGADIETIARAVSAQRNVIRLRAQENDPEALAATKASNLAAYGDENGPTADSLFEKYGSWETVLSKAFSTNAGMDACLGLYDDYYELYTLLGMVEDVWYTDAMEWGYANGVIDAVTADVYTPDAVCTRAEAVTLLWSALGAPAASGDAAFSDVTADSYFAPAVSWAYGAGITDGTAADTFSPDLSLTRAQVVTLLLRASGTENVYGENPFTDVSAGAYYRDAAVWAAETGVTTGTTATTFSPDAVCTRAEAVTFLYRFMTTQPEEESMIKTVKTENFTMDYFTFGAGEKTLVILPGASLRPVTLSADAVAAAYADFTKDYTVYLLVPKRNMEETYDVRGMAEDTAEAMELLGIKNADIFGCSLGGMIAQSIAIDHPELVHKLVLASTVARQTDVSRSTCEQWYALACAGDVAVLNREVYRSIYSDAYYEQYKDVFASVEGIGTAKELEQFAIVVRAFGAFDVYDELAKITCPTLVIGSWDDRTLSGEASVELARALGCPLYMYAGYGHAVYDEAPDYKARLLDFFAE